VRVLEYDVLKLARSTEVQVQPQTMRIVFVPALERTEEKPLMRRVRQLPVIAGSLVQGAGG
jgi:hypothetical protein